MLSIILLNKMKQTINNFLIGFLFVLGVILVPAYKVEAAITVIVRANGQSSLAVPYGNNSVTISWESTGATSCSESGGRGGTGTTGSFDVSSLLASTTFTVTCSAPAYCSGNYTDTNVKVNWEGSGSTNTSCIRWVVDDWVKKTSSWVEGGYYGYNTDGSAGRCSKCSDRENTGYVVSSSNWYNSDCNGDYNFLGICKGAHWVKGTDIIRSGYLTGSCTDFSQSCCTSHSGCTWHP